MIKLSDLLSYKIAIRDFDKKKIQQVFYEFRKNLEGTLQVQGVDFGNIKSEISDDLLEIERLFENIDKNLHNLNDKLQKFINSQEREYYVQGESIYQGTLDDSAVYIFDRSQTNSVFATEDDRKFFISRIKIYSDWRYPGVHIRPLEGEATDSLKAFDPLYLVETDEQLFNKVKTLWGEHYQRRLRYYKIQDQDQDPFCNLPQQQFGFALATEFFNYKSIEVVEKYLTSIYKILRPGGTLFFTFNDCDTVEGLRLVEAKFNSYTPGRQIKQIAKDLGYEITAQFHRPPRLSWLELRKPGQLTSMRNGQTLGALQRLTN